MNLKNKRILLGVTTGGLSESIARETASLEIITPWLTLDGLRIVWGLNL